MMNTARIVGHIDETHRLSVDVPSSIPPGPVTVIIVAGSQDDDAGNAWMTGIANEWKDELGDSRQDIYTLDDGAPVGEP